jgi:DNA repair protein RadA/Sms
MQTVIFGEVGLSGEIRSVQHIEARLKEAAKAGFRKAVTPPIRKLKDTPKGMELIQLKNIRELPESFLTHVLRLGH